MESEKPNKIKIIYKKAPNYRTYNIEGVVGGLTPKGKIFIDLFNEQYPVAEYVVHQLSKDGILGKAVEKKIDDGIVREIDCGIFLDIPTAIAITDWLSARIEEFKNKTAGGK